jgi:hypothetical protein
VDTSVSSASLVLADYFGGCDTDLASFLVKVACDNATIANFLFW